MPHKATTPRPSESGHRTRRLGRLTAALLAWLLVFLMAAPAGQAFFGEFTIRDEREMGDQFDVMIRSQLRLIEDPEIVGYVTMLTKRLEAHMPAMPWKIKVAVINNPMINAFAGPAGHLYVFSGLLLSFNHENEVAGVMAHELAHVSQRHLAQRIEQMQLLAPLTILGTLAGAFLGGQSGAALAVGAQAATKSAMLSYSREDEREADQVGMNYLLEGGFNPKGMVGGFEILRKKQWYRGVTVPTYLSTHPGIDERIEYLSDRIGRMPPPYLDRPVNDLLFHRVQTLLRARYTDPEVALRYFEDPANTTSECMNLMGEGIVLERLNRVKDAMVAFDKALACDSDDSLILREAGRFHYTSGDIDTAGKLLQKAILKNPSDLIALFFYARLQASLKNYRTAIEYMERVLLRVPEDPEVRYWLGRIQGESGNLFQGHLQLAYAAMLTNNKGKAAFHEKEAERLMQTDAQKEDLDRFKRALEQRAQFW